MERIIVVCTKQSIIFNHTQGTRLNNIIDDHRNNEYQTDVDQRIPVINMGIFSNPDNRRISPASSLSRRSSSSASSMDEKFLEMTLPIGPREDNRDMSEATRKQRMLAKCRKTREPWKSAKPLPARE